MFLEYSLNSTTTTTVKRGMNKYAFSCAILASMTSILLGYDIGVMSGASLFIKDDLKLNDIQIEIVMGILNLYSLIGSALAGRTSDWIGRRYTIVFAAVIFFAGAILMGFATNYSFLMVGRFVAGIGVGYAMMIAPVYTAEVAPASSRGFLTSFPEIFINVGILLGYVSNIAFSKLPEHLGWRVMLGLGAIPSVFLAIGVLRMPESPRWLILQGRVGEAKRVLAKTSDNKQEADLRLADIKEAAGIPESCTDDVVPMPKRSHGEGVWKELLVRPSPPVRRMVIAAIGIHFFQQSSGIDAVVLYSPRIFEKAGIKSKSQVLAATVAVGFTKTCFILVATFFIDKFGRRPLLLTSVAGMIGSLVLLASGLTIIDHSPEKKFVLGDCHLHCYGLIICCILFNWTWPNYVGLQLRDLPFEAPSSGRQCCRCSQPRHQRCPFYDLHISLQGHHHWRSLLPLCIHRHRGLDILLHLLAGDSREGAGRDGGCLFHVEVFKIDGRKSWPCSNGQR